MGHIISYIICVFVGFYLPISIKGINHCYDEHRWYYRTHRIKFPIWGWIIYLLLILCPGINICLVGALIVFILILRFFEQEQDLIMLGMTANKGYKTQTRSRILKNKYYIKLNQKLIAIKDFLNKKV